MYNNCIVQKELLLEVTPREASGEDYLKKLAAKKLRITSQEIHRIIILRKSVDARRRAIKVNLLLRVWLNEEPTHPVHRVFRYTGVTKRTTVIIVGAGPAGLFAALRLIELGYSPLIIERGKKVEERKTDIDLLEGSHLLNPDSNYCFGEGGAGTFSDGKLYTRSKKRGDHFKILEILHFFGADPSILYESHPHIGSDKLPVIIASIRKAIQEAGGRFLFGTKVNDLVIENGKIKGVVTASSDVHNCKAVILATGHSARDIYHMLLNRNLCIEPKPFAMGVRVEHPQEMINLIQYHGQKDEYLPPATYTLAEQAEGRGVYSFCMCPGGQIVPSATTDGEIVVNGMSDSTRNSFFANSGLVVQLKPEDYSREEGPEGLAALIIQATFEHTAYNRVGKNQAAPAQRIVDFIGGKLSASLPDTSYRPGIISSPMHEWMPDFIVRSLQAGMKQIDRKMKGFISREGIMVGVESRTSSPVKIPRDMASGMHVQVDGLFPCGEGSGYAGGIVSSAVDGELTANKVALYLGGSSSEF